MRTQFFGRQFARFSRNFWWTEQVFTIPLPEPKIEIGSTKSKDNLFAHYYKDIEHPNRLIRLSFRFQNNNSCVSSIKKFELHGKKFILTEIVNLSYDEVHHLYMDRSYVSNKCEIIESTNDVSHIHPWLSVWQ